MKVMVRKRPETEAQARSPDVQELGGGHIALGSRHITHHLLVPRLHRVSGCHKAQAAEVYKECVEQGPDDVVRHDCLAVDVYHSDIMGTEAWGTPSTATSCSSLSIFLGGLWCGDH